MSAKTLLSRLTASEINGFTEEAFLHAAGLWLDLGDADMARTLLNPILTWSDTVWSRVRASAVIDRFDAAEALRMVERAYATIGPSGPGLARSPSSCGKRISRPSRCTCPGTTRAVRWR